MCVAGIKYKRKDIYICSELGSTGPESEENRMEYTREFEFNGVRYRSSEDSVELSLSGAGRCRVDAKDEETADAFRDVLTALLPNIFELCGDSGVPYNFIAVKPDVITQVTKEVFAQILPEDSPTLISLAFTALCPDDESVKRLIESKRMLSVRRLCPRCGKDMTATPNAAFCTACGTKLGAPPEPPKTYSAVEEYILTNFRGFERVEAVSYYRRATGADAKTAREAVANLYKQKNKQRGLIDALYSVDVTPTEKIDYVVDGISKGINKLKTFFGGGMKQ